jgi:hypothetical protein
VNPRHGFVGRVAHRSVVAIEIEVAHWGQIILPPVVLIKAWISMVHAPDARATVRAAFCKLISRLF